VREELVALQETAPNFHAEIQAEIKKVTALIPQFEGVLARLDELMSPD
jgi:hypothetical protein